MTGGRVEITVVQGSLLEAPAEAIVNAANSLGFMGGGVAGAIKREAGQDVEDEARRHAPIAVGTAVLTSGGKTKFRAIIHAPTMPRRPCAGATQRSQIGIRGRRRRRRQPRLDGGRMNIASGWSAAACRMPPRTL